MKILSWILLILSIPAGLFMSFLGYLSHGLGLTFTLFGEIVSILGMLSLVVCTVLSVMGIIRLRRGDVKKAFCCSLIAFGYCLAIVAGSYIDDTIHSTQYKKRIVQRNEQLYGQNWDAPPAIEGIPELYQQVLNKFYAVVRDRWSADQLIDLGAVTMPDYYGDASLDNIGFTLLDLNGDQIDELLIGAVASGQQGNEIFCIYTDPENPFYAINSVEGDVYYLHSGETEGTYLVEIAGAESGWVIEPAETENTFWFNHQEGAMDPAGRMVLELTPFSQYK